VQLGESVPGDADAIAHVQVETCRATYRGIVPEVFLDDMDVSERAERWRQRSAERRSTATLWALDANLEAKAFYEALGWEADGATVPHDFAGSEMTPVRYRRLV
jgi:hypothetical protein